jgi:ribosomal protein L16 Arg81 hydroxylase
LKGNTQDGRIDAEDQMNTVDILRPLTFEGFCRDHLAKTWALVNGVEGKFAELLQWSDVNRALETLRVRSHRVRLARNGDIIAPGMYLVDTDCPHGAAINATAVTRLIQDGATLVLDRADELFHPVRDLADDLEDRFHTRVATNLYAGCVSEPGFDIHWDHHDAFILQVAGRKTWRLWEPTYKYPMVGERMKEKDKPKGSPVPRWQYLEAFVALHRDTRPTFETYQGRVLLVCRWCFQN